MKKTIFKLKIIINFILELLFPSKCLGCDQKNEILCKKCIDNIKEAERPTEENILALYDYRDPLIKKVIWKLKYYHTKHLGQKLGELLYDSMKEEINELVMFSFGSPIYIIPVPISHDRKKNRGYNQSEIIAKGFCGCCTDVGHLGTPSCPTSVPYLQLKTKIVYKNKNTIPQAKLTNRNKRLKNLKGAFEIRNKEILKGKTIIIIDDVTTTGATITEIIRILKNSGAKKVVGFAVAH